MDDLKDIIKNMNGKVIAIGTDEKINNCLMKNENIDCVLLNSYSKGNKKGRAKTIRIKKIRRKFKKKKIDYIICNYNEISKYMNTFIKDSVYITKNKIYYYNVSKDDINVKKYKRYNTKIVNIGKLIEIDMNFSKTNIFKDIYYAIIDNFTKVIEFIGDLLMG